MSRLLDALRNPYILIGQGFLFGGLIVLFSQDSRPAIAAPAPPAAATTSR